MRGVNVWGWNFVCEWLEGEQSDLKLNGWVWGLKIFKNVQPTVKPVHEKTSWPSIFKRSILELPQFQRNLMLKAFCKKERCKLKRLRPRRFYRFPACLKLFGETKILIILFHRIINFVKNKNLKDKEKIGEVVSEWNDTDLAMGHGQFSVGTWKL